MPEAGPSSKRKTADPPSADGQEPAEKKRRRTRACLECRALKVACVPTDADAELCKRCVQYGFTCLYVSHKRGRKPKSRITPDQASELKAVPATVSVHRAVSSEAGVSSTDGDPTQVSPTHLPPSFSQPTATLSSISPEASFPLPSPLATVLQQERPGPSVAQQQVPSIPAQHPLPPRIAPIQEEVVEYHASSREDTPDEEEEDNEGGRGSTFTFLNEQRNNVQHDGQRSPGQGQSVPARAYSMRALLRPVASIPSNYLPDVPSSFFASDEADDERVDPIKLGLVPEEFAQELFDFFIKQQNRWCGILEPEFDTYGSIRARSPFLFTSILCVASLFVRPSISSDSSKSFSQGGLTHAQLSVHALDLAMCSFADGKSSLETVQAFFLLSTWKDIDDSSSYLRMGFGRVLSLDLELSALAPAGAELTKEESRSWRSRQRLAMALFVQDRVQGFQFYRTHTLPLNDPLIADCTTWHLQKWARPQDAMLVASVQVRRIQSTYRDLITGVSSGPSRQGGSSTSATAGSSSASYESRRVMLDTIVPALQRELEDWYSRWSLEISRAYGDPNWSSTPEGASALLTMSIWQHSIQLHIASFALRDSLAPRDKDVTETGPTADAARSLAGLTALWPCIYSARSLLESFSRLPKDHLRTAPDTMSLLPTFAATFLWRLTHVQGEHALGQEGYVQSSLRLIKEATMAFSSAVVDPRDTILLHARYLASVAVRMERQVRSSRRAAAKGKSRLGPDAPLMPSHVPSPINPLLNASSMPGQNFTDVAMSSVRTPVQPDLSPAKGDSATSPEDFFPQMSFPDEWFVETSPQESNGVRVGELGSTPPQGTLGGFSLDMDLNLFLGFDTEPSSASGWGPWGEWAG